MEAFAPNRLYAGKEEEKCIEIRQEWFRLEIKKSEGEIPF